MNEHELGRRLSMLEDSALQLSDRLRGLERIEEHRHRQIRQLEDQLRTVERLVRKILSQIGKETAPVPGTLSVTFHQNGASMNAVLVATLPTLRGDGSALAPTDIASITFQKTSLGADGVTPGPEVSLQVNSAVAGAGLALTDTTFTDTSSVKGDAYSFFVTDTSGDAGAISNVVTNPGVVVTKPSAPAAGSLTATFSGT
jgi:hypothetical protein